MGIVRLVTDLGRRGLVGAIAALALLVGGGLFLLRPGGAEAPTLSRPTGLSRAICFLGQGAAEEVRIPAGSGEPLVGALLGEGRVGVVLAHQAGADMCQWADYAHVLVAHGYRVLAFDFGVPADDESVVYAAQALKALGAQRIVLMGASRGGTAVLAAAGKLAVDGVIALSAPAEYNGSDALQGVETSTAPLLIAAGELDSEFAIDAVTLSRHAKATEKRLIVKKGSGEHGVLLLEFGGHSVVDDAVLQLLARVAKG
jgi:pimeloyl-ACP methyl ester carboxylesterase